MRRLVSLALVLAAATVLLAACGGGTVVLPTAETVVGKLPSTKLPKGNPAAGKAVLLAQGCGSCHTFKPAGTKGTVGPDLDKLAADAQKANQGSLEEYTRTSILDPDAYIVPGYPKGVMPKTYAQLSPQQIADLVAFLTQKS